MSSVRELSDVRLFPSFVIAAILIAVSVTAFAQGRESLPQVISGPRNSGIPIPVANHTPGEKPPAALSLLNAAAKVSDILKHGDIECKGTMIRNGGSDADRIPITFVIGLHGRFEMTLSEKGGMHSVRVTGMDGQAQRKNGTRVRVDVSEFGPPLALPMRIAEIAGRAYMSLREDEEQMIDGETVRVLTATLFPSRPGESATASLYFDKATSQLRKVAMLTKTRGYRPLESFEITSYRNYKSIDGIPVPFEYELTRDGQVAFTVHVDIASFTTQHEDSFFTY